MKLVSRGDTTIVDAYLSPILRRYVNQLSNALPRVVPVHAFLGRSHRGTRFRGKDAILSRPAGGIVGMARTAQAAWPWSWVRLGGTSTDVSPAPEFEQR